jgi:hypothetical protein
MLGDRKFTSVTDSEFAIDINKSIIGCLTERGLGMELSTP